MNRNASRAAVVLAFILAGTITTNAQRDYRDQSLDLIRFLATKPWASRGHNRWDRGPRINADQPDRYGAMGRWAVKFKVDDDGSTNYIVDDDLKMEKRVTGENLNTETPQNWEVSSKRSALATALKGRRRRQPPSTPLDLIMNVENYFGTIRKNLDNLVSLSPQQRATIFTDAPTVVHPPASGGGGSVGGAGVRRLHALRPLRHTGNIRTYNRRSFVETDNLYPKANNHDPGLLWTGLGR